MKVQADIVNGIYEVDNFEDGTEVLPQDIFCLCLDDHENGIIASEIDKKTVVELDLKYKIKRR